MTNPIPVEPTGTCRVIHLGWPRNRDFHHSSFDLREIELQRPNFHLTRSSVKQRLSINRGGPYGAIGNYPLSSGNFYSSRFSTVPSGDWAECSDVQAMTAINYCCLRCRWSHTWSFERQVGKSAFVICCCRWIRRLPLRSCSVISSLGRASFAADMSANECNL